MHAIKTWYLWWQFKKLSYFKTPVSTHFEQGFFKIIRNVHFLVWSISSTFAFAALYIISCYNQSCHSENWMCCNYHEICSCVFICKPVPFLWRWHLCQTAASGTCQTGICTWCITSVWVATVSNNRIVACQQVIFDFKNLWSMLPSHVNYWHCDNISVNIPSQQSFRLVCCP